MKIRRLNEALSSEDQAWVANKYKEGKAVEKLCYDALFNGGDIKEALNRGLAFCNSEIDDHILNSNAPEVDTLMSLDHILDFLYLNLLNAINEGKYTLEGAQEIYAAQHYIITGGNKEAQNWVNNADDAWSVLDEFKSMIRVN